MTEGFKLKIDHKEDYRKLRRESYKPTGDQLDALYELAKAIRDAKMIDPFPQKVGDWIRSCENVKKKFIKDV